MAESASHLNVEMGSERGFGIVFAVVFAIIAAWPLLGGGDVRLWAAAIAAGFLLVAFVYPRILKPLNRLWFKFGMLLGAIIAPIVMALVYFLTVTPTGLIMRLLGKDLLRTRLDPEAQTYWIPRDNERAGSMKNQF